jgi:DNA-binding HxlR family transcriptional regulator
MPSIAAKPLCLSYARRAHNLLIMPSNQALKYETPKRVRICSIWRALEVLGDVPTLLILESIWLSDLRFDAIKARTCLSKPLIAERLKKLTENGILDRRLYCAKPARYEYHLSTKGLDLFPVTMMLLRWEKIWSARREIVQMDLIHSGCGASVSAEPMCGNCQTIVRPQDIEWREGPGLEMVEPDYTRRRQHRKRQAIAQNLSLFTDSAELLGDRWAGLVMRAVFTGLTRFSEILQDSGIASNILAERLDWLRNQGFLIAYAYQTNPARFAYHPTAKALDYLPILLMLQRWGDKYYGSDAGYAVILYHKTCGSQLEIYAGCGACKGALQLDNVTLKMRQSDN